ncbi:MAG TPA: hypothetical protein VGA00_15600 [Acidiferrobacterales bacterium]
MSPIAFLILCASFALPAADGAAPARERAGYEGQGITLSVSVRTPEQVVAFYSARGFPENAVRALAEKCLVTVGMRHRRRDVVWLEPARWRFVDAGGREVRRLDRAYWAQRWEALAVPAASRATFGWTQLPESRDLLPGEPVGGNVVIEPPAGRFRLELRFATGADKRGPALRAVIEGLSCAGGGAGGAGDGGEFPP